MFLLRCAFWLAVVYATMWWNAGPKGAHLDAALATGRMAIGAAATSASADAAAYCQAKPAQCLAEAHRLTSLVNASLIDDDADAAPTETTTRPTSDARHHRRGVMSAQNR